MKLQKTMISLAMGIVLCIAGVQACEANPTVDMNKTENNYAIGTASPQKKQLALKFEVPKPKAKPNINDKTQTSVLKERNKQEQNKKTSVDTEKEKKEPSAKKKKDEQNKKTKNDKLTANEKYEQDAQTSQTNINKRKAAMKQSGISKQEQKENEIILNYQTQKVAVELAQRKLANAQGASTGEISMLKKQLAEEEQKLKPVRSQFDSLKITLPEKNVSAERCNLIKIAKSFVGTPYRFGGVGGRLETDCGKFTKDVLAEWGKKLQYRTACGQYFEYQEQKRIFTDKKNLKPGDLIFYHTSDTRPASDDPAVIASGTYVYKGVTHVGIYQGNGCVIHASTSRGRVIENAAFEFAEIVGFGKTV